MGSPTQHPCLCRQVGQASPPLLLGSCSSALAEKCRSLA